MPDNRNTVLKIYEAFGRGDVPGLLSYLAEDVEWEYHGGSDAAPWFAPGRGHAHVVEFLTSLATVTAVESASPGRILAEDDLVISLFNITLTVKATGKKIVERDEPHVWWFNAEGKVSRFRHGADTHQHHRALQAD